MVACTSNVARIFRRDIPDCRVLAGLTRHAEKVLLAYGKAFEIKVNLRWVRLSILMVLQKAPLRAGKC